ncbi:MAG TPA: hypothetical protein VFM49_16260, partial [Chloroflexia bacterium]|nr:hypothetical protein [Chloroflexia bacterium]
MAEHPTRRLDRPDEEPARDQYTRRLDPSRNNAPSRPCIRCGQPMVPAEVRANYDEFGALAEFRGAQRPVVARRVGESFVGTPKYLRSECDVLVCTECGY